MARGRLQERQREVLGGIVGSDEIRFIGEAGLHGLGSARDLLRERDGDVLLAIQAANQAASDKTDEYLRRLARYIINELGKSMS